MFHVEQLTKPELPMTFATRADRTAAKKRVAAELKTTVRMVNKQKLCDKPLESVMKREKQARKALEHREKCAKYAQMVLDRAISCKNAAKECSISERQMSRYMASIVKAGSAE